MTSASVSGLTGPSAVCLGDELAAALTALRQRPVTIEPCGIDEYLAPRGLPPPVEASLAGFLQVLSEDCASTSGAVEELTGAPPRQFVRDSSDVLLAS